MSGYLDVKYPFKSNLGLNPFKSWKRQWCILRPSATCSGGSLAVYCSEAGASAGKIDLPTTCIVRRAKSRSRPHAFAIFSIEEPRKPRVLLAANTLQEAQIWMGKIRDLLNGSKYLDSETLLRDSFSATVEATELSRKCGLNGTETSVCVARDGCAVSRGHTLATFVPWRCVRRVALADGDKRTCIMTIDSAYQHGGGELRFMSPLASELVANIRRVLKEMRHDKGVKKLSKSEGDLRTSRCTDSDIGEIRRSSWYSGPSDVSLDDIDLVMSKEWPRIPCGRLSRCIGAGDLAPAHALLANGRPDVLQSVASLDDSMSDRRSLVSIASGIYEEILDLPDQQATQDTLYCKMSRDLPNGLLKLKHADLFCEEPMYECVGECVYATIRRPKRHSAHRQPPPLPPRLPARSTKLGDSWVSTTNTTDGKKNVTRHSSLGSLPRLPQAVQEVGSAKTLPKPDKSRQGFNVFRKRLKSDSRITSPKSESSKENKDIETKKKKFDFTPTKDIFKSFKVSRKMKNLKITNGLTKGETKSCEFLDETEHIPSNRCSKSVECLEGNDEFIDDFDADLSIDYSDDPIAALSISREIVDLLLNHEPLGKVRLKSDESEYLPMSPIAPIIPQPPMEHHYIVMSPRSNVA